MGEVHFKRGLRSAVGEKEVNDIGRDALLRQHFVSPP